MDAALVFGFMMLICGFVGIALMAFWVWMLIDCASNEPSEGNDKIVWVVIVIFAGWIGALIYYLVRRPERVRLYGK